MLLIILAGATPGGGDISFTATELVLIGGIVGPIITAVVFMFRQLVGAYESRLADKDEQIEFYKSLSDHNADVAEKGVQTVQTVNRRKGRNS